MLFRSQDQHHRRRGGWDGICLRDHFSGTHIRTRALRRQLEEACWRGQPPHHIFNACRWRICGTDRPHLQAAVLRSRLEAARTKKPLTLRSSSSVLVIEMYCSIPINSLTRCKAKGQGEPAGTPLSERTNSQFDCGKGTAILTACDHHCCVESGDAADPRA